MTETLIPRSTGDGPAEARSRQMLASMRAFRDGNFSARLPSDWNGIDGQIAAAFNQAISYEDQLSREVERLSRIVGLEGRLKQRMSVPGAIAGWAAKVDFFNTLLDDLVRPTTEISRTIGAVARGDLGQSMDLEVDGQAQVKGVSGVWQELTDSVNQIAGNLTAQVRNIAEMTIAVADGDLAK